MADSDTLGSLGGAAIDITTNFDKRGVVEAKKALDDLANKNRLITATTNDSTAASRKYLYSVASIARTSARVANEVRNVVAKATAAVSAVAVISVRAMIKSPQNDIQRELVDRINKTKVAMNAALANLGEKFLTTPVFGKTVLDWADKLIEKMGNIKSLSGAIKFTVAGMGLVAVLTAFSNIMRLVGGIARLAAEFKGVGAISGVKGIAGATAAGQVAGQTGGKFVENALGSAAGGTIGTAKWKELFAIKKEYKEKIDAIPSSVYKKVERSARGGWTVKAGQRLTDAELAALDAAQGAGLKLRKSTAGAGIKAKTLSELDNSLSVAGGAAPSILSKISTATSGGTGAIVEKIAIWATKFVEGITIVGQILARFIPLGALITVTVMSIVSLFKTIPRFMSAFADDLKGLGNFLKRAVLNIPGMKPLLNVLGKAFDEIGQIFSRVYSTYKDAVNQQLEIMGLKKAIPLDNEIAKRGITLNKGNIGGVATIESMGEQLGKNAPDNFPNRDKLLSSMEFLTAKQQSLISNMISKASLGKPMTSTNPVGMPAIAKSLQNILPSEQLQNQMRKVGLPEEKVQRQVFETYRALAELLESIQQGANRLQGEDALKDADKLATSRKEMLDKENKDRMDWLTAMVEGYKEYNDKVKDNIRDLMGAYHDVGRQWSDKMTNLDRRKRDIDEQRRGKGIKQDSITGEVVNLTDLPNMLLRDEQRQAEEMMRDREERRQIEREDRALQEEILDNDNERLRRLEDITKGQEKVLEEFRKLSGALYILSGQAEQNSLSIL